MSRPQQLSARFALETMTYLLELLLEAPVLLRSELGAGRPVVVARRRPRRRRHLLRSPGRRRRRRGQRPQRGTRGRQLGKEAPLAQPEAALRDRVHEVLRVRQDGREVGRDEGAAEKRRDSFEHGGALFRHDFDKDN